MANLSKYKLVRVPKETYENLLLIAQSEKCNLNQKLSLLIDAELERLTPPFVNKKDVFDVLRAIHTMKQRYIRRALAKSKNVTLASKLLGLNNYQILQNWMRKLGI